MSTDAELYLRGTETLLASWEEYARGASGAVVLHLPGVAAAVFLALETQDDALSMDAAEGRDARLDLPAIGPHAAASILGLPVRAPQACKTGAAIANPTNSSAKNICTIIVRPVKPLTPPGKLKLERSTWASRRLA